MEAPINLQGGGGYGTEWHTAGNLINKQYMFEEPRVATNLWRFDARHPDSGQGYALSRERGGLVTTQK